MKKLNNRQNQVKSLDFSNPQAFIFKDPKHQVQNNLALTAQEKQQMQKSPQIIKGPLMGQTTFNKAAPQKSEINHYNKKYQGTIGNFGNQPNIGKLGSGVTLSYAESTQSFKPSPVKSEGINSKNFPLNIQKAQNYKAQKIKIGLHKKAASLMNSNQISGHSSAVPDHPQQIVDLGKNLQFNQQPLKMMSGGGMSEIESQKQSIILSQQTSFNEYMSSNNEMRQQQQQLSQTLYGMPQVDNFLKSNDKGLFTQNTSLNQHNLNSTSAGLNRYTPGNNLINTMNSTANLDMTAGIKSFDQRQALGQILNSNQQSTQRMSLIGSNLMGNLSANTQNANRSHTNSFKNPSGQIAMKHSQNKYVKAPQNITQNMNNFQEGQAVEQEQPNKINKKTLQNHHQRTFSDTNQYMGQSAQLFFQMNQQQQQQQQQQHNMNGSQISNRQQFQELIKSVNEKDQEILINTMQFANNEELNNINNILAMHQAQQNIGAPGTFSVNQASLNNFNVKTTLGSSRQSVQSSTHLDDRDAIIHHYKGKGQMGMDKQEKYSDLKTIYNGMLREQMQKNKQALKLTQQQFGGPSRKVVSTNNTRAMNANTQSYRASNYAPLQGNAQMQNPNVVAGTISGQNNLISSKISRVSDNKSTPKLSNQKKAKNSSKQAQLYQNTSAQGNRSSNNTTQVTNQPPSSEKAKKKQIHNNFIVNGIMNNTSNIAFGGANACIAQIGNNTTNNFKRISTGGQNSNGNNIVMMNSIKQNSIMNQPAKVYSQVLQQQQIGHKRSASDGNSILMGLNHQYNFATGNQDPKNVADSKMQLSAAGQIIGGSAPISELSNIPDSSNNSNSHYQKKQSHQHMSTSLMQGVNEYEWVQQSSKSKGKAQKQQLHSSDIMSMANSSLVQTERQGTTLSQNNNNTNQIANNLANSHRFVVNQAISQQQQIHAQQQQLLGGGLQQQQQKGHARHNSQMVTVDSNNKILGFQQNNNPSLGTSIPNSTKKSTISDVLNNNMQGKQSLINKGKLTEMMIEDQSQNFSQLNQKIGSTQKPKQNIIYSEKKQAKQNINEFQISEQYQKQIQLQPQLKIVEERIETQDSAMSDPNLSPRAKMQNKLIRKVKLAFNKTQNAPATNSEFYKIGKVMGKGAFGKVNLAVHRLSEKFVALKSINKQFLNEEASKRKVMQEFNILRRTRHKNVVRLYESFETQQHIVFVMEVCGSGDLLTYVRRRRKLKEDIAKHVFKQIIEGLKYIHSKNILHRDIKLDNILLTSEGDVKICDFGVSKIVKNGEIMTEQCGTPAYIAPEVFENRGYENYASDVWSAGVVLYAMLYGTVPFKASNMSELQRQITRCQTTFKEEISSESLHLLKSILEKDPTKRLSINDILKHPWMQDIPENVSVFTEQEKQKINSEFAYYNFKNDLGNTQEIIHTDPFTEQMLNSTQNSLIKNVSTKSVILAPFNSTRTHIDEEQHNRRSIQDLLVDKKFIKFAAKVKEINRQYELNNNAELDNGVYHQDDEEEEEGKQKANNEKKANSLETSFDKDDGHLQEDKNHFGGNEDDKKLQNEIEEGQKMKKQSEWQKIEQMMIDKQKDEDEEEEKRLSNIISSQKKGGGFFDTTTEGKNNNFLGGGVGSAQTLVINEQIIQEAERCGFPRQYVIQSLNNDELNYATTFYFLLTTTKEF